MTVSSTTNRKAFTGDAVTTSFGTSPVVFFETSELVVQAVVTATGVATTLVENTDYTVSGGAGTTGTVNLAGGSDPYGAPASTETLVIRRVLPFTQTDDFVNNDINDAEVLEDNLDRGIMLMQQLDEEQGRALKVPASEGEQTDIVVAGKAGYYLRRNVAGNAFELAEGDPNDSTFTNSGTGAVERSVTAKLGERVSVKDFGALGDGSTDDTATIAAAITALNASGGGLLYFPEGTYVASSVVLQSYVRLVGDGFKKSILQHKTGTTTDFVTLANNNTDYFGIEDIYVKGDYVRDSASDTGTDADTPDGINITRSADSTTYLSTGYGGPRLYFRNVLVQYFGGDGISFNDTSGGSNAFIGDQRLENVYVGFNQGYGVYSNKPTALVDSVWYGVHSYWNKKEGFLCRAAATNFIACKAFWNGQKIGSAPTRVALGTAASGWLIQDCTQVQFVACEAQDNGLDGFKTDTNSAAPTRLQFSACVGDTNLGSQFNFNTGTRILATGTAVDRASLTASMVGVTIGSGVQSFDGNFVEFGMDTQYTNNATVDTELQVNGVNVSPLRVVSADQMAVTGADNATNNTTKIQHFGAYHYDNTEQQILAMRVRSAAAATDVEIGGGSASFNAATQINLKTAANNTTLNGTTRVGIDNNGDVVHAGGAADFTTRKGTTDTTGFFRAPSTAGAPTGVPAGAGTYYSGSVPIQIDVTNGRLYAYYGGAWHYAALT